MSQQGETGDATRDEGEPAEQLTVETLNRYLAAAADDREAAEERSAQIITRFTKLTMAMLCVTMVIAGANVAMMFQRSSAAQPVVVMQPPPPVQPVAVIPVRPAETQATVEPPMSPEAAAPVPAESKETAKPAEKIPLLGSPPAARPRPVPAAMAPRMARAPIAPPRPLPLLSVRNVDNDAREAGPVERW